MSCRYGMTTCSERHGDKVTARMAERLDSDLMVSRMLAWYDAATGDEVADGITWYDRMGTILTAAACSHGHADSVGIEVAAILSPRADWDANLKCALAVLSDGDWTGPILHSRVAIARHYVSNPNPDGMVGPKVRAFACNLSGCKDCVTVDTWHARVAFGDWNAGNLLDCPCYHSAIAEATRIAAARVGLTPRDFQAVVWLAIHRSNPNGRVGNVTPA